MYLWFFSLLCICAWLIYLLDTPVDNKLDPVELEKQAKQAISREDWATVIPLYVELSQSVIDNPDRCCLYLREAIKYARLSQHSSYLEISEKYIAYSTEQGFLISAGNQCLQIANQCTDFSESVPWYTRGLYYYALNNWASRMRQIYYIDQSLREYSPEEACAYLLQVYTYLYTYDEKHALFNDVIAELRTNAPSAQNKINGFTHILKNKQKFLCDGVVYRLLGEVLGQEVDVQHKYGLQMVVDREMQSVLDEIYLSQ